VREREREREMGKVVKRKREAFRRRYMTREETARYREEFYRSEVSKMNCLGQQINMPAPLIILLLPCYRVLMFTPRVAS
jgi:hypothetical protein